MLVPRLLSRAGRVNTCKTFGSPFTATGPNHRYCSRACRPSGGPAHPEGRRPCATCGTLFIRASYAQRYCSTACRPSEAPAYPMRKYAERVGRPLLPRGGRPDLAKRAKVAELRAAGWTLKRIGAEVGVSEARVSQLLARMRAAGEAGP
jgi:hypothetical protein